MSKDFIHINMKEIILLASIKLIVINNNRNLKNRITCKQELSLSKSDEDNEYFVLTPLTKIISLKYLKDKTNVK